jgi:hypothetical protein
MNIDGDNDGVPEFLPYIAEDQPNFAHANRGI